MGVRWVITDKSLRNFFVIAFLIPIVATVLVTLIAGAQSDIAISQLDASTIVVMMAMVHAPTIAAMFVAYREDGFEGIKHLFRQLKYWRFKSSWYLRALLIFPFLILAALLSMNLLLASFSPMWSLNFLAIGNIMSTLWEEIGWTGYATPRILKRFSPLKASILLGVIHTFWHLAADYWGSGVFYGSVYRYAAHFFLWLAGLTALRIITIWIYIRTNSLVLGWLTHFSYTGGQVFLVSSLSPVETLQWNSAFVVLLIFVLAYFYTANRDFRAFWKSRVIEAMQLESPAAVALD